MTIEIREFGLMYVDTSDHSIYTIEKLADMISADITPNPYEAFDYARLAFRRLQEHPNLIPKRAELLGEIVMLGLAAAKETTLPDYVITIWEQRVVAIGQMTTASPRLEDLIA